jgi:hemoglobin-like flavoprotein
MGMIESLGSHFDDSYDFILSNDSNFFDSFYTHFFNSSNLIKNTFAYIDMDKQKQMLRESIKHLVKFYCTNKESEYLKTIARHHADKVRADEYMYKLFVDSFIQAIEDTYPNFCEETALVWRCALKPGIDFMNSYKA